MMCARHNDLSILRLAAMAALLAVTVFASGQPSGAEEFIEPPVFISGKSHVLDILMIARPQTVNFVAPKASPTGWVYQVCYRPPRGNTCPHEAAGLYGGFRLQLQPGDLLKIRLVNKLPSISVTDTANPTTNVERIYDDPLLALNPTNIHTHGLIVDANANSNIPPAVPEYGDFIFVSVFNPENRPKARIEPGAYSLLHAHGDIVSTGIVDYHIQLGPDHPIGQFWIHPHLHGVALNQISAGLAGIITVGDVGKYACGDKACKIPVPNSAVRHLILKDMQVMADNKPQFQEDTMFCQSSPKYLAGYCAGTGGNWYFTVNGRQFPTVRFNAGNGEVWRIQNASASATYDLQLVKPDKGAANKAGKPMQMQLLAVDGINIHIPPGTSAAELVKIGGSRFRIVPCPLNPTPAAEAYESVPVCVTDLVMMPSSRAEVYVTWRDDTGFPAAAPAGATAILRTIGCRTDDGVAHPDDGTCNMGVSGDQWPAVDLATINFPSGIRSALNQSALYLKVPEFTSTYSRAAKRPAPTPPNSLPSVPNSNGCAALPAGHRRRLYFGNPIGFGNAQPSGSGTDNAGSDLDKKPIFGIGYEEIKKTDYGWEAVEGTFIDLTRFDPTQVICVPLGAGNAANTETWEIVNLTQEMHNFHIHQGRFLVGDPNDQMRTLAKVTANESAGIWEDNVPLPFVALKDDGKYKDHPPRANSCPIGETNLKSHKPDCTVTPVIIQIPFSRLGEFVFHCHILEHEDGGMMHVVRVVPPSSN